MRDVVAAIEQWQAADEPVALATVIQTWGSSPRQAGAKMALTPGGALAGSVSGGCVEGAVFEAGVEALAKGRCRRLHFGVADETAWEVGLACGGSIDVFVQPLSREHFSQVRAALARETPFAIVTLVEGPGEQLGQALLVDEAGVRWSNLAGPLAEPAEALGRGALAAKQTRRAPLVEGVEAFAEVVLPPPTVVVIGGAHITIALVALAKTLGYRTVVIDPRKAFGNEARFPPGSVDRLVQAWPDEALAEIPLTRTTAVAMLTHDPKLDDLALKLALSSPAFYVGALGSRITQAKRRQRLLADGLTEEALNRLHGPIGLDLNATTPEEVALSIMAQIVGAKNQT
ncbi:MAG: XdhC family protein [Anaerolineales bacterium]|nr:XdhC family protein [Anaerolineales bacterium]